MEIRILDDEEWRSIYHGHLQKDFHQSEIKPYSLMEKLVEEQRYLCYGLYDQGDLQGYAFFVKVRRILLLDYFAILSAYRSGGLGGRFIRDIQESMRKDDLILFAEVENPAYAADGPSRQLMNRRIQFYQRNGFTLSKIWSRVFTDEYIIIYYNEADQSDEDSLMLELKGLYQMIFGEEACRSKIHVRLAQE
ncbi:MAG: acetyltransferase, family [Herbinix sp.]|jgi:GNAT superfamily N-acetyltransferase|nr:acetyltransferase, family [Herbinix sp.]